MKKNLSKTNRIKTKDGGERGGKKRHAEMKKWPPLGQMREDPPKIGAKLKREGRGGEKRHAEMKNGPHWGKCAKTHQMVSRTA